MSSILTNRNIISKSFCYIFLRLVPAIFRHHQDWLISVNISQSNQQPEEIIQPSFLSITRSGFANDRTSAIYRVLVIYFSHETLMNGAVLFVCLQDIKY